MRVNVINTQNNLKKYTNFKKNSNDIENKRNELYQKTALLDDVGDLCLISGLASKFFLEKKDSTIMKYVSNALLFVGATFAFIAIIQRAFYGYKQ